MSTTILLDHGIITNSSCMEWVKEPLQDQRLSGDILGLRRRAPLESERRQEEVEAIYTVGRLIREGAITAYSSAELLMERLRGRFGGSAPPLALWDCEIQHAPTPIERSKFFKGEFGKYVRKGGKNDCKNGDNSLSQIAFFEFLCRFKPDEVELFLSKLPSGYLTEFEIESFRCLGWFQKLSKRMRSSENLPDTFHVWTAERNSIDILVTLDDRLINQITAIRREKMPFKIAVQVMSPLNFIRSQGVEEADAIPYQFNQFYSMSEVPRCLNH